VLVCCIGGADEEVMLRLTSLVGTTLMVVSMHPGGGSPLKTACTIEPKTQNAARPCVKALFVHIRVLSGEIEKKVLIAAASADTSNRCEGTSPDVET
jgi:hypothetical protein